MCICTRVFQFSWSHIPLSALVYIPSKVLHLFAPNHANGLLKQCIYLSLCNDILMCFYYLCTVWLDIVLQQLELDRILSYIDNNLHEFLPCVFHIHDKHTRSSTCTELTPALHYTFLHGCINHASQLLLIT